MNGDGMNGQNQRFVFNTESIVVTLSDGSPSRDGKELEDGWKGPPAQRSESGSDEVVRSDWQPNIDLQSIVLRTGILRLRLRMTAWERLR